MPTEDEQIRTTLNAHWQASASGDVNAEHDIYADDSICDYPQSGERILGRQQFAGLAESSSRQTVRLQDQADARKRGSLDHGIHNHVPGASGIHGEHYGVPQRQGRPRNTVFRGPLRGAGLAEAMGSGECVTPGDSPLVMRGDERKPFRVVVSMKRDLRLPSAR